ncbi:hypothetical protein HFRIS_016020 [Herbaspirillum frisingense GSF30]|uniref:Uncharacterized protein n=1 Tax=Herbaspirillum frisingense GSF30 TaxID=864073 RepID=A0AAI9ICU9_9BURK|nr:hypothetical protein [Herbaspirillum frisingense]EOA03732.1 hypothetical protein HFRIS_016020 [Herbaspirillum frisingense GSF30]
MEELFLHFLRSMVEVAYLVFTRAFQWPRQFMWLNDEGHFITRYLVSFIGGCITSGLTLFLVEQLSIWPHKFLTITLFVGPFGAACLFQEIGRYYMSMDSSYPRGYFSQALWYALGFASMRFFIFPICAMIAHAYR